MIKVCGANEENQLTKYPNSEDEYGNKITFPPIDIQNNSFLSCSFLFSHTAIITREGVLQAIGDNCSFRISASLPRGDVKQLTEIPLEDSDGNQLFPISVFCGHSYLLLIVSTTAVSSDSSRRLAFFSWETKTKNPIFVSNGGYSPVALYGGSLSAAAIDTEGGITFMRYEHEEFSSKNPTAPRRVLPDGEAAVCVACCVTFYSIVGSSGRLFVAATGNPYRFDLASELSGVHIKEVNGAYYHCLAVSSDGRAFVRGDNNYGRLGLGDVEEVKKFTEITSLRKYKIVSAAAGDQHSLFLTAEGKILACGFNRSGQLLLNKAPKSNTTATPVETSITKGALFFIAGYNISIVFFGEVPPNMPNRPISQNQRPKTSQYQKIKVSQNQNKQTKPSVPPEKVLKKPEPPRTKAETSSAKPKTTNAKTEAPSTKPEAMSVKAEAPSAKPKTTNAKDEAPSAKPKTTNAKDEAPSAKPEATSVKAETPSAKPETPNAKPETTQHSEELEIDNLIKKVSSKENEQEKEVAEKK